jgi:hypothetical protein
VEEVELIFVAELESELLDVQIDPWSHKLADSGASWSIELYRAEGSRSQCDRLWGWGAEVQIGTGLRSLVPPEGTQVLQSEATNFSDALPVRFSVRFSLFCRVDYPVVAAPNQREIQTKAPNYAYSV